MMAISAPTPSSPISLNKMKSLRPTGVRGYTIAEVIVAMVLTGLVVAGTLRALTAQKRFYARQARILDARHAMRAVTTILSSELREVSAPDGDLYGFASDSLALRSTTGFAVVCGVNAGSLSLVHISGYFVKQDAQDSSLVFVESAQTDTDDSWRSVPVDAVTVAGPVCASGDTPERVLSTNGSLAGIWVGSAVRLVRPYVYALFQTADGRWWLGRRLSSDTEYIPVAGPLAPPGDNGLILTYLDTLGAPTLVPAEIVRVGISVRAPTNRTLSDPAYTVLSTSTYLRNGGD